MPQSKRLRIFAGPNGSGKSTLFDTLKNKYNTGLFINADLVEKEIRQNKFINIDDFNLKLTQANFDSFLNQENTISLLKKASSKKFEINLTIIDNIIISKSYKTNSYEAALITSFIRNALINSNQTFSYETVMTHFSKLEEISYAKEKGFKTYLYFICLEDANLNISRVKNRVFKGGHDVDESLIIERYHKTLTNLLPAINIVDKVFIFDNSKTMKLIAEGNGGALTLNIEEKELPNWFIEYILNKI
jgi:predicted ABC-type ATPase